MKVADLQRLEYIRDYCDEIAETLNRFGNCEDIFANDKDFRKSIALSLLEIGELVKGLSKDFRNDSINEVPWDDITGMRDWVAHGYRKMEIRTLFNTANIEVPKLKDFCTRLIERSGKAT